ncbi:MAG TPA: SCO family protein [Chitinophagales bacterium]|nr:SCO family protein [Chitinophagales bacterium]
MNINRKLGFTVAVAIAAVFPIIFLIIFANIKQPNIQVDTVLPIYGNKTTYEREDMNGKIVVDTNYHTIPKFSFTNQLGDTITDDRLKGVVTVVDFFFTTCPTICIDMAVNKREIQSFFLKDNSKIQILSFTVDPETDTQERLLDYAYENNVNSNSWNLVTGDKVAIYDLARKGFMVTATEGDGGEDDFIHDNKFVLIDREKRIRGYYDGTSPEDTERLKKDIQKLSVSYIIPHKEKK